MSSKKFCLPLLLVLCSMAPGAPAVAQTARDIFSNPRSSGFLQLVDGAGTINFVRGYYADADD